MENKNTLRFEGNPNGKLGCEYFTVLRRRDPEKFKRGNQHKLFVEERGLVREYGSAEVVSVRIVRLHQLNDFICGLELGKGVNETKDYLYEKYKEEGDVNVMEFDLVLYRKVRVQAQQNKLF